MLLGLIDLFGLFFEVYLENTSSENSKSEIELRDLSILKTFDMEPKKECQR